MTGPTDPARTGGPAGAADTSDGVRVILADDHEAVRAGLRLILGSDPGITVLAEAADGRQVLRLVEEHRPDVLLLDVRMPLLDGLGVLHELLGPAGGPPRRTGAPAVVVLTTYDDGDIVPRTLAAGAAGFLLKTSSATQILAAVKAAAAGDAVLDPAVTNHVVAALRAGVGATGVRPTPAAPDAELTGAHAPGGRSSDLSPDLARRLADLTDREREVLRALGLGLSNSEIAASLHIGITTVKTHVSRVLDKLDLTSRVQAALLAREVIGT